MRSLDAEFGMESIALLAVTDGPSPLQHATAQLRSLFLDVPEGSQPSLWGQLPHSQERNWPEGEADTQKHRVGIE